MVLLMLSCCLVYGQLSTKEIPYSWKNEGGKIKLGSIPQINLPNLDLEALHKEDLENSGLGPYRFGFSHDVSLNLNNSGVWETMPDGGLLWRLRIYSPDALSLNLLYDKFWLPEGAKFFIYSEDVTQSIGAFTSRNNKGSRENMKGFATSFLFAKNIVLEYYEPADVSNEGIISIAHIVSGYRSLGNSGSGSRQEEPGTPDYECFIGINCPVAVNWQEEKNAVALIVIGGGCCSGALLNTTANDNEPIFLTANHCFVMSGIDVEQWMFVWNYEEQNCVLSTTSFPEPNKSTSGATQLARREDTDFLLLKLDEDPAENTDIEIYYLGWDRSTIHSHEGGIKACIHHFGVVSGGGICYVSKAFANTTMNIYSNDSIICWSQDIYGNCLQGISPLHTHWRVAFSEGNVRGGSSGSPILNQKKRVFGQLHGGWYGCPKTWRNNSAFGRFDLSWDGSTSATRLRDWLDPLGKDLTFIDGKHYCITSFTNQIVQTNKNIIGCNLLTVQNVDILSGVEVVMTAGEEITINDFHAAAGTDVSISIRESGKSRSPVFLFNNDAPPSNDPNLRNITLHNTGLINTDYVFKIFPNPNSGAFQLEANFPLSEIAHLKITNLLGVPVYETKSLTSNEIKVQNSCTGLHFVIIILNDGTALKQKMMVHTN